MSTPRQKPLQTEDHVIRLAGVKVLAESAGADDSEAPVWSQIANAGQYKGYDPPFDLTADVFNEMVTNFRAHPAYHAGAAGVGDADVIPWDFEHLSDPGHYDATTPQVGAPAQGWIRELKVQTGLDGKAQLWALTSWLPLAKQYIRTGQYKWASIAFVSKATDPVSGKQVGVTLISVAMTNDPFIQGMQSLAAKNTSATIRAGYWNAAEDVGEALREIKRTLGLPETSDVSALAAEFAKLRQWATVGGTPVGVDLTIIFRSLRQILNLPALSGEVEVLGEADKIVTRILEEQAIQSGQAPAPAGGQIETAMVAKGEEMPELMKALAKSFGVRETESEVQAAADDSVLLRAGLQRTLAAERDATKVLLEAVQGVVAERDQLNERSIALTKALGIKNDEDPIVRIVALQKSEQDITELKPQFDEMSKLAKQQADAEAEADVARVLQAHGMPDNSKTALLMYRKESPEKFAEDFPVAPDEHAHLTATLTTSTRTADPGVGDHSNVIDLNKYSGRNDAEKMVQHILATNPAAKDWTREQLFSAVHDMRRAQAGR